MKSKICIQRLYTTSREGTGVEKGNLESYYNTLDERDTIKINEDS